MTIKRTGLCAASGATTSSRTAARPEPGLVCAEFDSVQVRSSSANSRDRASRTSVTRSKSFRIGLGKFTDRVARAQRESGPIDEPTLGQVVIRRLDERTRLALRPCLQSFEPANQPNRHVEAFEASPFSGG